ncbi:hypothetical protein [Streptomyces sp. CB02923]|uniref:hypothetical protein n=1 Tax=Streptomyces sp. CB02923 TaxID=1718985 RepID=UPI0019011ECA|nr:hypothetical protein [Streptomyces sp. CB02923]
MLDSIMDCPKADAPHTCVVCAKDNVIPAALQRRFIREIDAVSSPPSPARRLALASSHLPFLAQPAALAAAVAGLAGPSGT